MAQLGKLKEETHVQDAREEYFAGKISADEYLRRVLPEAEQEHGLSEQFRRILGRLKRHSRS